MAKLTVRSTADIYTDTLVYLSVLFRSSLVININANAAEREMEREEGRWRRRQAPTSSETFRILIKAT